jgi:predicted anti-sigma-YlaC factor YlaD
MKCVEMRELLPELAAGNVKSTPAADVHLQRCDGCRNKLEEFRRTMALLEEWQAAEPSNYFDVRLQARMREERARASAGPMAWFTRPAMALAATVLLAVGVGLFRLETYRAGTDVAENVPAWHQPQPKAILAVAATPGTAVGDLQALERNNELYADFEVLDELEVQPAVIANP